jgi:hypothetical protein
MLTAVTSKRAVKMLRTAGNAREVDVIGVMLANRDRVATVREQLSV